MKFVIPGKIRAFLNQLEENGHEAYVVGGAVRDMLLDIEPKDWDIATSAVPGQIKETFADVADVKQIDASFPVVVVDGIEIATYRADVYKDGVTTSVKRVETIEEDLGRRDLTINAMAIDKEYRLIDPYNGRADLEKSIIRFVGKFAESDYAYADLLNAEMRIDEDPCRVIRACRFLAAIDGQFTAGTLTGLKQWIIADIPRERIRLEILKAMKCKAASKFFIALHDIGLLGDIFPSLEKTWGQDHGQYHDENIFDHMMIAGDYAGKNFPKLCLENPMFRLTTYLHDVGKSEPNYKIGEKGEDDEIHFYDHEQKGYDMLKEELAALKFSTSEIKYATNLVLVHMRGGVKMSPKTTRKLIKRFVELNVKWKEWLILKVSDKAANTKKEPLTAGRIMKIANKFIHELHPESSVDTADNIKNSAKLQGHPKPCFEHKQLAISGTRIQQLLGIGPSQLIGVILDWLLNRVLADPSLNTKGQLEKLIIGGTKKLAKNKLLDLYSQLKEISIMDDAMALPLEPVIMEFSKMIMKEK